MKKKILITLLVLLSAGLFIIVSDNSDPRAVIFQLEKKGGIREGEFRYAVNFLNILPVGNAVFFPPKEEKSGAQGLYHLSAKAESLGAYSAIFSFKAQLDSFLEPLKFNPVNFRQRLFVKGKGEALKDVFYDQEKHIMTIEGVQRQIFPDTQDPLSAIYHIRRMALSQGKEFSVSINTNQKNYILKGACEEKTVSIYSKSHKLLIVKAHISRRDKNPYHKSYISMVLLREKDNIPILIKVFAGGILMNIKLIEIK